LILGLSSSWNPLGTITKSFSIHFIKLDLRFCHKPIQTDSIKNIGIRKVKNDKVDARKIALLYRFQELKTTNIPDEDIECLRSLCRQYYKLSDELTAYKNRLMGIVDQLMLNFKDVFPNIFSKAALAVLEKYPAPAHILKANRNKLIALIQKNSAEALNGQLQSMSF